MPLFYILFYKYKKEESKDLVPYLYSIFRTRAAANRRQTKNNRHCTHQGLIQKVGGGGETGAELHPLRSACRVAAGARPVLVPRVSASTAAHAVRNAGLSRADSARSRAAALAHAAQSRTSLHKLTGCCSLLHTASLPHAAAGTRSRAHHASHLS